MLLKPVAWVTGGSRGIGRAIALRLAEDGLSVGVGYHRHRAEAEAVLDEIDRSEGCGAVVGGDLGTEAGIAAAYQELVDQLDPPDILVANHGIYTRASLLELTREDWQRTLDVNLTGPFLLTQRVLPAMIEQGWGRIVYMGSIRGRTGSVHGPHYAAAKAGLVGLARSVATDAGPDGVTANVVAPGMIDTDILAEWDDEKRAEKRLAVPVRRIGRPEDVAEAVSWLVSKKASYVNGTVIPIDGYWPG